MTDTENITGTTFPVLLGGTTIGRVRCTDEGWVRDVPAEGSWDRDEDGDYGYVHFRPYGTKVYPSMADAASALTLACIRSLEREAKTYYPEVTGDGLCTFIIPERWHLRGRVAA